MPSCQDDMPWVSATPPSWPLPKRWMWHTLKDSLWGVKEKSHQCILNEGRLFQNICIYIYVNIHLLKLFMVEMIFLNRRTRILKKKTSEREKNGLRKKILCPPTSCSHPTSYSPSPHSPFPRNFSDIVDAQDPTLWNTTFATNTETSEQQKNMNLI